MQQPAVWFAFGLFVGGMIFYCISAIQKKPSKEEYNEWVREVENELYEVEKMN
jgi:hypothetical protein